MADQMKPTPRNSVLGLFSDLVNLPLQYMSAPERTQQMQGTAQFLYGTGIPKTLERMSYGDSLFSGTGGLGGTTRMRPETADALMNVAPFAPAAGRVATRAVRATDGLPVGMGIKDVGGKFNIASRDASDIFGVGSTRIRYTEPNSGGSIEVLTKPDGSASVLSLEVPEKFRGKRIGESLQAQVMQDFPVLQGQVSSKAAAKTAYRLGRRPPNQPDASLEDVFKIIDENSSVNMVSPAMQSQFIKSSPKVAMTSDGYKFYEQPDGSYTNGDMTFESLDELFSIDPQLTVNGKIYSPKAYFEEESKGTPINPLYDDLFQEHNPLTSPFADLYKKGYK